MPTTLLDAVNSCMVAMDSWEVSDIDDSLESQQASKIIEVVFNEVVSELFYNPLTSEIIELEALADSSKPNYLKIPSTITNIHESKISYNKYNGTSGSTINYQNVQYLHPQDFLEKISTMSTLQDNTQIVVDFSGVDFVIRNNKHPSYCTSFDQEYLVFDSFDSDVDSTLQASKSRVLASVKRSITLTSAHVIDLPEYFMPTFLALARARVSEYLREEPSVSDVRIARSGMIKARNKMRVGNRKFKKKRYGR